MKKTLVLTSIFFLILFFSSICQGNFSIQPRELSITMNDGFIQGNTLKSITIKNNNNYGINISWYLDHPDPSMIRPNKTSIPDLSWIEIKPQWQIIPSYSSAAFDIYLDIPENEEHVNQHWEIWPTFKQNKSQGMFNLEQAVRLYINTPTELITNSNQGSDSLSIVIGDKIKIPLFDVAIVAIIILLLIIGLIVIKKKKL